MELDTARDVAVLAYEEGRTDLDNLSRLLTAIGQTAHEPGEIPQLFVRTLGFSAQELAEYVDRVNRRRLTQRVRSSAQATVESEPLTPLRAAYGAEELAQIGKPAEGETIRHRRYVVGRELGRGGVGRVVIAWDRYLNRSVALKVALPGVKNSIEQLAAEAKTTGGLEHPNIIPVHDLGILDDGTVFYAMKHVRRHTLYEILRGLRLGDAAMGEEYSLVRLLGIFQQVCMALHYAHAKGVVHRDIKPDNIMVGEYGEVLVMDWGLAMVYAEARASTTTQLRAMPADPRRRLVGTPEYMPPEQARGETTALGPRSDVYALGAVLYEILTFRPPHTGRTAADVLFRVLNDPIVSARERAPERDVPAELDAVCLRALALMPDDRFQTAKELRDAVEAFLDGRRRHVERKGEADRAIAEAEAHHEQVRSHDLAITEKRAMLEALRQEVEPDAEPDQRRRTWLVEDELRDLGLARMDAFEAAEAGYQRALALMPDDAGHRSRLARLYLEQSMSPVWSTDPVMPHYYRRLVNRYDAEGVGRSLAAPGYVTVQGSFSRATIVRLAEQARRLRPYAEEMGVLVGQTHSLPPGPYELRLSAADGAFAITTCMIERDEVTVVELGALRRPPSSDFVYVPGGPAIMGAHGGAHQSLPLRHVHVPAFFAGQYPVTFGEYAAFLTAMYRRDPDRALRHVPRTAASGMLCDLVPGEGYRPGIRILAAASRALYPQDSGAEWMVPVFGVSFLDCQAYIAWRCGEDGRRYRLLRESEWEKLARGGDGRNHPWGDTYDSSFCLTLMTHRQGASPEPVGVYHPDISPFGARDLAGGVQTWTLDVVTNHAVVKGGAWNLSPVFSHAASRRLVAIDARLPEIGLRLAIDTDP